METSNTYFLEAEAYYRTTTGAIKKADKFGNTVIYNLIGLSAEGYLTAMLTEQNQLPEHSSIGSMLRAAKKWYDVPQWFQEEARFFNRFMNFCALDILPQLEPTSEEIGRMVHFLGELRQWASLCLTKNGGRTAPSFCAS